MTTMKGLEPKIEHLEIGVYIAIGISVIALLFATNAMKASHQNINLTAALEAEGWKMECVNNRTVVMYCDGNYVGEWYNVNESHFKDIKSFWGCERGCDVKRVCTAYTWRKEAGG